MKTRVRPKYFVNDCSVSNLRETLTDWKQISVLIVGDCPQN